MAYQTRYPSAKTLTARLDVDPATARQIRGIMRGDIDPETLPGVSRWVSRCYNRPSAGELEMAAIAETLEVADPGAWHGVEAVFCGGAAWPWLEYINAGDTYATTVCRVDGFFRVACWGDIVERDPRGREG